MNPQHAITLALRLEALAHRQATHDDRLLVQDAALALRKIAEMVPDLQRAVTQCAREIRTLEKRLGGQNAS